MKKLNDLLLLNAIRRCSTEEYRVGIFFSRMANICPVFQYAMECITDDEEEYDALSDSRKDKEIRFKNGSIIKFLSASNNARGHAFNEVLYEEGIDEDILHVVVQPTEKLYPFQKIWIDPADPWNTVENTWNNAPVYWWMRDTAGGTNYLDYIDQRNYGLFI